MIAGVEPGLGIAFAVAETFLYLALSALPLAIAVYTFEPFGVGIDESVAVQAAAVILGISWIALLATRKRDDGARSGTVGLLAGSIVLLIAFALLSTSWAEDPGVALSSTLLYVGAFPLALLVATVIRTGRLAVLMAGALFAGACATALYAFFVPKPGLAEAGRLGSGSVDPNELAAILILGLAFAGPLMVAARRAPAVRVAIMGGSVLCLVAFALTVSRGGLIAIVAALVLAPIVAGRWRPAVLTGVLLIALSGAYYLGFASPDARERVEQAAPSQARLLDGRTTIWQVAGRVVADRPVRGVGAGNFTVSAKHYLLEPGSLPRSDQILDTPSVAHNTFLQFQTELGVVGLILFSIVVLFALVAAGHAAHRFKRQNRLELEALARATIVALVAFLVACFFMSQERNKHLWFLLGYGPALSVIARRTDHEAASAQAPSSTPSSVST